MKFVRFLLTTAVLLHSSTYYAMSEQKTSLSHEIQIVEFPSEKAQSTENQEQKLVAEQKQNDAQAMPEYVSSCDKHCRKNEKSYICCVIPTLALGVAIGVFYTVANTSNENLGFALTDYVKPESLQITINNATSTVLLPADMAPTTHMSNMTLTQNVTLPQRVEWSGKIFLGIDECSSTQTRESMCGNNTCTYFAGDNCATDQNDFLQCCVNNWIVFLGQNLTNSTAMSTRSLKDALKQKTRHQKEQQLTTRNGGTKNHNTQQHSFKRVRGNKSGR